MWGTADKFWHIKSFILIFHLVGIPYPHADFFAQCVGIVSHYKQVSLLGSLGLLDEKIKLMHETKSKVKLRENDFLFTNALPAFKIIGDNLKNRALSLIQNKVWPVHLKLNNKDLFVITRQRTQYPAKMMDGHSDSLLYLRAEKNTVRKNFHLVRLLMCFHLGLHSLDSFVCLLFQSDKFLFSLRKKVFNLFSLLPILLHKQL